MLPETLLEPQTHGPPPHRTAEAPSPTAARLLPSKELQRLLDADPFHERREPLRRVLREDDLFALLCMSSTRGRCFGTPDLTTRQEPTCLQHMGSRGLTSPSGLPLATAVPDTVILGMWPFREGKADVAIPLAQEPRALGPLNKAAPPDGGVFWKDVERLGLAETSALANAAEPRAKRGPGLAMRDLSLTPESTQSGGSVVSLLDVEGRVGRGPSGPEARRLAADERGSWQKQLLPILEPPSFQDRELTPRALFRQKILELRALLPSLQHIQGNVPYNIVLRETKDYLQLLIDENRSLYDTLHNQKEPSSS